MPKPAIGRIVHITMDPAWNNGADVAPAIITRVWNDACVNLRVLADSQNVEWKTSVPLFESRDALEAHFDSVAASVPGAPRPSGAFWPERV
ncbi:hypothetical protein [Streptomyces sp. NPDC101455]|uniref:hypothetical protein n=1 Tax=Streptomyces sp. NPDC101455 TaxID=3366142 RepID=UPI0037FB9FA1